MNLKQLLGEDLYKQVEEKIEQANEGKEATDKIRFVDLSEGGYVSKEKYTRIEGEKNTLKEQFDTQAKTLEGLKKDNRDNEELQKQIKQLNEDLKVSQKKGADLQKTYTLKEAIAKEGCLDPDYLIYKEGGLDKFAFDDNGSPIGVSDITDRYKDDKSMAHLFRSEVSGNYKPRSGSGSPAMNPFAKDSFNLTEQSKLFKENPEQARELAAEAGVKL